MKFVVKDAPSLKSAVDAIVNLIEEGEFEIAKEGLKLKAMDPSQISMVSFFMPKESFEEYEPGEDGRIAIDMRQLASILSRGKKGEKAEVSTEEGRLVVKFIGKDHRKTFKIPLMQVSDRIQREPKIAFNSYVKIKADALKEALKDAKLISSHVRLIINKEEFIIDVRGDYGNVTAEFDKNSEDIIELKTEEGAKATFPLQYLEDMMKAAPSSSPVTINLETDKPLKMEYELEGARIVYYLAPRIETE